MESWGGTQICLFFFIFSSGMVKISILGQSIDPKKIVSVDLKAMGSGFCTIFKCFLFSTLPMGTYLSHENHYFLQNHNTTCEEETLISD